MFDDIFGDMFGGSFGSKSTTQTEVTIRVEYEARIDSLKKKARTLIDLAYNKALNDVLVQVGDSLTVDEKLRVAGLKRVVRK